MKEIQDIIVSPFRTMELASDFYYSSYKATRSVCGSREGDIFILNDDFDLIASFKYPKQAKGDNNTCFTFLEVHPTRDILYVSLGYELVSLDFKGQILSRIEEPIEAMYFEDDGESHWLVKRLDDENIIVSYFTDDRVVDSIPLIGCCWSAVMLSELPQKNSICLMMLDGSGGSETFFLSLEYNKIICKKQDNLLDAGCVSFSTDGTKFLTMDASSLDTISCYLYPSCEKIGEFILGHEKIEEEIVVGYYISYINNRYALVELGDTIYYILDTQTMKLKTRILVEGYEPKPISFFYPRLTDEHGEMTGISPFHKTSSYFITSYSFGSDAKNVLLLLKQEDILKQIENLV